MDGPSFLPALAAGLAIRLILPCHAMPYRRRLISSRLAVLCLVLATTPPSPPPGVPTHTQYVCMIGSSWGYCVHPRLPPGLPDNRRQMIQMLQIPNSKYQMPGEERRSLLAHPSRPTRTQADGRKWPVLARPARVRSARVPLAGEAETSGCLLLAACC